jgi:Zn-dependent protease/predicted transcriptional regulator
VGRGWLAGTSVRAVLTALALVVVVTCALAGGSFPQMHPGWAVPSYWWLGALTSVLLLASVLAHELAHRGMARVCGIRFHAIGLYFFGDTPCLTRTLGRPRDEFLVASAGPLTSLVLAALWGAAWWTSAGRLAAVSLLSGWLACASAAYGLVNLLPSYPMDGADMLSALLRRRASDHRRALLTTGAAGQIAAVAIIIVGVWMALMGAWPTGVGMAFVGFFLRTTTNARTHAIVMNDMLASHTACEVMHTDCPAVAGRVTLDAVVRQALKPVEWPCILVVDQNRVRGLLTVPRFRSVSRRHWITTTAEEVMTAADVIPFVPPDADLRSVLECMAVENPGQGVVPVVDHGGLLGVITQAQLETFIHRHIDSH